MEERVGGRDWRGHRDSSDINGGGSKLCIRASFFIGEVLGDVFLGCSILGSFSFSR